MGPSLFRKGLKSPKMTYFGPIPDSDMYLIYGFEIPIPRLGNYKRS